MSGRQMDSSVINLVFPTDSSTAPTAAGGMSRKRTADVALTDDVPSASRRRRSAITNENISRNRETCIPGACCVNGRANGRPVYVSAPQVYGRGVSNVANPPQPFLAQVLHRPQMAGHSNTILNATAPFTFPINLPQPEIAQLESSMGAQNIPQQVESQSYPFMMYPFVGLRLPTIPVTYVHHEMEPSSLLIPSNRSYTHNAGHIIAAHNQRTDHPPMHYPVWGSGTNVRTYPLYQHLQYAPPFYSAQFASPYINPVMHAIGNETSASSAVTASPRLEASMQNGVMPDNASHFDSHLPMMERPVGVPTISTPQMPSASRGNDPVTVTHVFPFSAVLSDTSRHGMHFHNWEAAVMHVFDHLVHHPLVPPLQQGMTEEEIKRISSLVITDLKTLSQSLCVICQCEFRLQDKARRLICSHYFHLECVDHWLRLNRTCPICRMDAYEDEDNDSHQPQGTDEAVVGDLSDELPLSPNEPEFAAHTPDILSTLESAPNLPSDDSISVFEGENDGDDEFNDGAIL